MKTIFKRSLSALAAMALTATCMVVASVPTASADGENLSIGATAFADSDNTTYNYVASSINDSDYSTRWQSNQNVESVGYNYAGVQYAASTAVDKVVVWFETARPNADGISIEVSDDGVNYTTVTNLVVGTEEAITINPTTQQTCDNIYKYTITFDTVETTYIRIYMTNANNKTKEMSIWEFETYCESSVATPTGSFGMSGAQIRANTEDAEKYDLRFITNFSSELYGNLANITDLGVVMVRADQLEAAGLTTDDITVDLEADGLTVKKVQATYLRNVDLATTGNYTYTVTITGIADTSVEYVCVGYYTTAEGTVYTDALTKSVAEGLAA